MVASEADGAPLQPPHPTMPPYIWRVNCRQPSELKFRAERPRIPTERYSSSLGTQTSVASTGRVPTTMEIHTPTDNTNTMHCLVPPTPLRPIISRQQHHRNDLRSSERSPATHDKQCRMHTTRYRSTQPWTHNFTALHSHYTKNQLLKKKKQKNTISLRFHQRRNRLPSIPENRQLRMGVPTFSHHPLHPASHQQQYRHQNLRNKWNKTLTKTQQHSLQTKTSQSTHHDQPHSTITTATTHTTHEPPGQFENSHNHPYPIDQHTTRSPLFPAIAPISTDPTIRNSSSPIPDSTLSPPFSTTQSPFPRPTTELITQTDSPPLGVVQTLLSQTCADRKNTMIASVDTANQQLARQSTLTPFDEAFEAQQQKITQLHLKLELHMEQFFAFIEKCQNNRSPHVSAPFKPPPPTASRSSGCWQHRSRCTNPQRRYGIFMNSPTGTLNSTRNIKTTGRQWKNKERSIVPVPGNCEKYSESRF